MRGLVVNGRFSVSGIEVYGAGGDVLDGNFLGTDPSGEQYDPWGLSRGFIYVINCPSNRIGTDGNGVSDIPGGVSDYAERNLISGSAITAGIQLTGDGSFDNVIAGNYIGTDATGTVDVFNAVGIGLYYGAHDNRIGVNGDSIDPAAERNVISGNLYEGILTYGTDSAGNGCNNNVIAGNYIGTDATGTHVLGNFPGTTHLLGSGIVLESGQHTQIGVNGSDADPAAEGNVISGNLTGIALSGGSGGPLSDTIIAGNDIGTDASGTEALGNLGDGIGIDDSSGNLIGTDGESVPNAAEGNVISANAIGIDLTVSDNDNLIEGNFIGTDTSGTGALGNTQEGILISQYGGCSGNTIGGLAAGAGNTIAFNTTAGVFLGEGYPGSTGDELLSNAIFANGGLGIELYAPGSPYINVPEGIPLQNTPGGPHVSPYYPNDLQNFPVLTAVTSDTSGTTVQGVLNSAPNTTFTIQFFSNTTPDPTGFGQGQTLLGTAMVSTDGNGNASFAVPFSTQVPAGQYVSATATDPNGNTSEFSLSVGVDTAQVTMAVDPSTIDILLQDAVGTLQSPAISPTTPLPSINLAVNPTTLSSVVSAIDGLAADASSSDPVPIVLNLAPGTYSGAVVAAPAGVQVTINGGGEAVVSGNAPAFELDSGSVLLEDLTFSTATDSPTILVTGGSLTVRDSTIQSSTGDAQPAILITGGLVDLGTAASPGGNTIDVNGSGELVHDPTSSSVSDIGNTLEVNGTALSAPDLSFTALASPPVISVSGQSVTLTATVRAADPSDGTPSGTVDFFDVTSGTDLGTALVADGVATLSTQALTAGSHTIRAEYARDGHFAFSLDVAAGTTTSLVATPSPPVFGQPVTFTATVATADPGMGYPGINDPMGTVTFYDGSTVLGTATLATGRCRRHGHSVHSAAGGRGAPDHGRLQWWRQLHGQ